MANPQLGHVGDAFANVGGAIAECVRSDLQNTAPPVEHFERCLDREVARLRQIGEPGLAEAFGAIRAPLSRLMKEGW